jgi:hypothetical protein
MDLRFPDGAIGPQVPIEAVPYCYPLPDPRGPKPLVTDSTTCNRGRPFIPGGYPLVTMRVGLSLRPAETSDDGEIFASGFWRLLPFPPLLEEVLVKRTRAAAFTSARADRA